MPGDSFCKDYTVTNAIRRELAIGNHCEINGISVVFAFGLPDASYCNIGQPGRRAS